MTIGEKIKNLRKNNKWSQAELAGRVDVHVTHISRLETERYAPSLELLKKLAEAFEVTTDYLLYESADNIGPLNFKDKTLYEKMKLIDTLEEADRSVISGVIDAFLTKHQMWQVLNKKDIVIQQ
jgi:transcriptional regulator with XRE-family HTH domain